MVRLSTSLRQYVGIVVALGLALLAFAMLARPIQATAQSVALAAAFAALIGLAGVYPLPFSAKIKANVATAPAFAAVLLLSPGLAAAAGAIGVAASELVLKRRWRYVAFNAATASLYVGGAALAYAAVKSDESFFSWPSGVPAAILAAAIIYAVNRVAVAQAAAMQLQKSALGIWLSGWKQDAIQELALFSLGFAGAISVHLVTWSLVPLVFPVAIVYKMMAKVVALSVKLEAQMAELRATQAQLVQAAKMASLGTLTAGLGHQINNPIFVIRGRSELLLEGAERHLKSDKSKQHIEVIHEMAERITRIVRCLLTSTRPTEDGRACADINDAIETMLALLNSKITSSGVEVIRAYGEGLPPVPGDAIEIQEMLGNLISNACDAMPRGGTLRITTRRSDSSVIAEISDTGVGIPEANLAKVFDPFFTTKELSGGTGLGLYVVRNIAERRGGTVKVESKVGEGTTFRIILPAADAYYTGSGKTSERNVSGRERIPA